MIVKARKKQAPQARLVIFAHLFCLAANDARDQVDAVLIIDVAPSKSEHKK